MIALAATKDCHEFHEFHEIGIREIRGIRGRFLLSRPSNVAASRDKMQQ